MHDRIRQTGFIRDWDESGTDLATTDLATTDPDCPFFDYGIEFDGIGGLWGDRCRILSQKYCAYWICCRLRHG